MGGRRTTTSEHDLQKSLISLNGFQFLRLQHKTIKCSCGFSALNDKGRVYRNYCLVIVLGSEELQSVCGWMQWSLLSSLWGYNVHLLQKIFYSCQRLNPFFSSKTSLLNIPFLPQLQYSYSLIHWSCATAQVLLSTVHTLSSTCHSVWCTCSAQLVSHSRVNWNIVCFSGIAEKVSQWVTIDGHQQKNTSNRDNTRDPQNTFDP